MDVAIAVFVRAGLKHYAKRVAAGKMALPDHALLVADFQAAIRDGSQARVSAPHLVGDEERGDDGKVPVRSVLTAILAAGRKVVRKDEADYLDLVERMIRSGTLSERIRDQLLPHVSDEEDFTESARRIYIELADALEANEPWRGRDL